jgi:hypothetical protein
MEVAMRARHLAVTIAVALGVGWLLLCLVGIAWVIGLQPAPGQPIDRPMMHVCASISTRPGNTGFALTWQSPFISVGVLSPYTAKPACVWLPWPQRWMVRSGVIDFGF